MSRLLLVLVALAAEPAGAQPSGPEEAFGRIANLTVSRREMVSRNLQPALQRAARAMSPEARAGSLSGLDAATVVKRAQAALKTSVDGAEAGAAVGLLALLGVESPGDVQVSLATLEGGRTRFGSAGSLTIAPPPCGFDAAAERRALDKLAPHFVALCDGLVRGLPAGTAARGYCGYEPLSEPLVPLNSAMGTIQTNFKGANVALAPERQADLDALIAYKLPEIDKCLANTSEALLHGLQHPVQRLGLSGSVTNLAWHFGFEPDAPLPQGEWVSVEATAAYSARLGYTNLAASLGWARTRAALSSPLTSSLRPAVSISTAVLPLSTTQLLDNQGRPALEKEKLPPRLVVGMDVSAGFAVSGDVANQGMTGIDIVPRIDFRVSEEIALRLAIPLHGERLSRDSTGEMGIGWSVPAFITTVLELP